MEKGETWLKLYRSTLDWEWYSDTIVTRVFLHLLLIVNIKDMRKKGIDVPAGSIDITQMQLAEQLHLSRMQVRRAINALISTNEITIKKHHDFSVISITRWSDYQGGQPSKQPTDNQQTTNRQPSNNHLNKNRKNINNGNKYIDRERERTKTNEEAWDE